MNREDLYRKANRAWLKLCCGFGWHRWVYDQAGRFRTCKHNWCGKSQTLKEIHRNTYEKPKDD